MAEDVRANWERFLNPKVLSPSLILAFLYITTFQVLKNSIIKQPRDVYSIDLYEDGKDPQEYKEEVLSRHGNRLRASLEWLKESLAIDENDIKQFDKARKCRNLLALEIPNLLSEGLPSDFAEHLGAMVALLDRIERWWIVNYEIPVHPDLADKIEDIDEGGIVTGVIASLQMMVNVALGSDETANYYIDEFRRRAGGS